MKHDELLAALRSVANKGAESPHLETVASWVRLFLLRIPVGDKWDSRQLYAEIERAGSGEIPAKLMNQAMWRLRSVKALEGCWSYDMTRRFMANPLVVWNRPASIDAGVF